MSNEISTQFHCMYSSLAMCGFFLFFFKYTRGLSTTTYMSLVYTLMSFDCSVPVLGSESACAMLLCAHSLFSITFFPPVCSHCFSVSLETLDIFSFC